MRILVTGGAGFIGSHLCAKLLENNDNYVICLDNLFSGSLENIKDLSTLKNFEFVKHDVTSKINIENLDRIYHLACPASPVHYQKDPIYTLKTNFLGTLNVLELAKENNVRVLLGSTSEVYGDPLQNPQNEGYFGAVNCVGPRSCYDEGKRVSETLCNDFNKTHNVEVRIARIFNTYGPKMLFEDGRVVSNFIVQGLLNEKFTIYGNGMQTRSFCFVSDLVDGLILLMESNEKGPINLGNPNEITITKLANTISSIMDLKNGIECFSLPIDDPKLRCPDITKAIKILGWKPVVTIEEGLRKTIDDFKIRARFNERKLKYAHQTGAVKTELTPFP